MANNWCHFHSLCLFPLLAPWGNLSKNCFHSTVWILVFSMSRLVITFLRLLIFFAKSTAGCINSPYTTYRKLADARTDVRQMMFIFLLAIGYFVFASLVRVGIHHPFLLTLKFNALIVGGGIGFAGMVGFLFILGRAVGGVGSFKTVSLLWAYSLLPTIIWFFTTSFFYLVLPPPRSLTILGKLFSVVFITFSLTLFLWKLILYYLTLRFGLRLDLLRIGIVSSVLIPAVLCYSVLMYRLGIFRVPFL